MILSSEQISTLKELMQDSAQKGNLANSGMVLENDQTVATAESWVVTNHDATAHSERMLVGQVGKLKGTNYTPGLVMISVVEPCVMCMSACSQAGFSEVCYIIPAQKYFKEIPWVTDGIAIDKFALATQFSSPIKLTHLAKYETDFCQVFEEAMARHLKK